MERYTLVTPDDEVGKIIHEEILDQFCQNYILVGEEKTCLAEEYLRYANDIKNFEVHNSDIWIASYPKTGTTWTQEMVWMIMNNLDYKGAETSLHMRSPFFEASTIMNFDKVYEVLKDPNLQFGNTIEITKKMKSPRLIKTHLPFYLLPNEIKHGAKTPKIIYIWRNPKDVCVSYHHHGNLCQGWRSKLENFAKVFMAGKAQYGSFWDHVLGYWKNRNLPNLHIIKYEDMKADLPAVIKKVAKFLDKEVPDDQMERLCKHLSFESMQTNPALNGEVHIQCLKKHNLVYEDGKFIRSGIVGKYKEELSRDTILKLDAWINESVKGSGLENEYNFNL